MTEALFRLVATDPVDAPPGRVYLAYYQLSEAPFAITPDPEFLFSYSCHRQMLDKIGYAIDGRMGFVLLTGEVGTGKTTLCRTLLDRLSGEAETVYVINPSISGHELMASILEDLGETPPPKATKKALIDRLNQRLLADVTNRPFVVIIDDAQTMTAETLEDLRLLSNLESDKRKLIQVVLSGQPELLDILADDRLRQLKQRIAVHCRLTPLTVQETAAYIARRLFVAGNKGQVSFSPSATRLIHKRSGGIPRLINKICDFALTAAYVDNGSIIEPVHVKRALTELAGLDFHGSRKGLPTLPAAAMILVLIAAAWWFLYPGTWPLATASQTRETINNQSMQSNPASRPLDAQTAGLDPLTMLPAVHHSPQTPASVDPAGGNIDGTASNTTGMAGRKTDDNNTAPPQPAAPAAYALQLGSFRTLDRAKQGVAQYLKKGVTAHWQMVAAGQWYRIVTGKFEDPDQALRYKTDHQLKAARVIRAPWTVRLLPKQPDLTEVEILRLVSAIGYDGLMETGQMGDNEIHTGLFGSVEDASITAERINRSGKILAQVVAR